MTKSPGELYRKDIGNSLEILKNQYKIDSDEPNVLGSIGKNLQEESKKYRMKNTRDAARVGFMQGAGLGLESYAKSDLYKKYKSSFEWLKSNAEEAMSMNRKNLENQQKKMESSGIALSYLTGIGSNPQQDWDTGEFLFKKAQKLDLIPKEAVFRGPVTDSSGRSTRSILYRDVSGKDIPLDVSDMLDDESSKKYEAFLGQRNKDRELAQKDRGLDIQDKYLSSFVEKQDNDLGKSKKTQDLRNSLRPGELLLEDLDIGARNKIVGEAYEAVTKMRDAGQHSIQDIEKMQRIMKNYPDIGKSYLQLIESDDPGRWDIGLQKLSDLFGKNEEKRAVIKQLEKIHSDLVGSEIAGIPGRLATDRYKKIIQQKTPRGTLPYEAFVSISDDLMKEIQGKIQKAEHRWNKVSQGVVSPYSSEDNQPSQELPPNWFKVKDTKTGKIKPLPKELADEAVKAGGVIVQ